MPKKHTTAENRNKKLRSTLWNMNIVGKIENSKILSDIAVPAALMWTGYVFPSIIQGIGSKPQL